LIWADWQSRERKSNAYMPCSKSFMMVPGFEFRTCVAALHKEIVSAALLRIL
jgi:hypothetical protein